MSSRGKIKMEKSKEKDEEDERREAALASISCLHSNITPPGITTEQLSKFQELHRRRLQIKSKSKPKKKLKDNYGKFCGNHGKQTQDKDHSNKSLCTATKESSLCTSKSSNAMMDLKQEEGTTHFAPQKRQKLHWGLDTKERWERKANM